MGLSDEQKTGVENMLIEALQHIAGHLNAASLATGDEEYIEAAFELSLANRWIDNAGEMMSKAACIHYGEDQVKVVLDNMAKRIAGMEGHN